MASRITGIARRSLLWKGRRKMRHDDSVNFHVVGPFANAQAGREEIGCDTEYIIHVIQYCLWWFHQENCGVVASFQSQNELKAATSYNQLLFYLRYLLQISASHLFPAMPLRPSKVTAWPYDDVGISNETMPFCPRRIHQVCQVCVGFRRIP